MMRFVFLLTTCFFVSAACEFIPAPPSSETREGHWEIVSSDGGYEPVEEWRFEEGALVASDTISWCRCSEQGRQIERIEYGVNEINVFGRIEGTYVPGDFEVRYLFNDDESLASWSNAGEQNSANQAFEYDDEGALVQIISNGETIRRAERNAEGQITRLFENERLISRAEYNAQGQVIFIDSGNGVSRFTYDDEGRLATNTSTRAQDPSYTSVYRYNDDSTIARIEVTRNQNEFRSLREFTYDDEGRLIRSEFIQDVDTFPFVNIFEYEDSGRLSRTQYFQHGELFSDHQIEYLALEENMVEVVVTNNEADSAFISRTRWRRFAEKQKRPPSALPRLSIDYPSSGLMPTPPSAF